MDKTIIDDALEFVRNIFNDDYSGHDYFHTLRVYKMATRIAEQENANLIIVQLAALLHDVDDIKLSPETYANKDRAVGFLVTFTFRVDECIQSVCSLIFLGLCILACFTAFWRDGSIQVSPLSAALMTVFFVLFGITVGVFVGSFLLEKRKFISIWIPSIVSSLMTFLMYIGEMIILNGHLYSFGTGFMFTSLPGIVFAPIDLLIILAAACITALIFTLLKQRFVGRLSVMDD